jgi:exosortase A-associated hydrolase 1
MNSSQRALRFFCQGCGLVGIVDLPERPLARGVLIVTGGAQYRIGSHRQFTLLARTLSARGVPVMRFDQRGMGDSEGAPRGFETVNQDIAAAVKEYFMQVPEMKEIVIWGLCEGATAAVFYAVSDARIGGLVLVNPWVRSSEGAPRPNLRQYYLGRLAEREFWKKVATGNFDFSASAAALREQLRLAHLAPVASLPQRVSDSLADYPGQVLVVLSGDDLVAREFSAFMSGTRLRARRVDLSDANHTFASRKWRDEVAEISANWVISW